MYNVYKIDAKACYDGFALVAAESVEDANEIISDFKAEDPHNKMDSWGYGYVTEYNLIENLYSSYKGIIDYGIHV